MINSNRIVILIDGGYFSQVHKKRQRPLQQGTYPAPPIKADVEALVADVMTKFKATQPSGDPIQNTLLRSFYYDCLPYAGRHRQPSTGATIDFGRNAQYAQQIAFLDSLKDIPQMALRLGILSWAGWNVAIDRATGTPRYKPNFRQKGVDIKIGLDMAWMAGKKTVDHLILVGGDSDFISPLKLVRREGILVYLYSMGQPIKREMTEHSDFTLT